MNFILFNFRACRLSCITHLIAVVYPCSTLCPSVCFFLSAVQLLETYALCFLHRGQRKHLISICPASICLKIKIECLFSFPCFLIYVGSDCVLFCPAAPLFKRAACWIVYILLLLPDHCLDYCNTSFRKLQLNKMF